MFSSVVSPPPQKQTVVSWHLDTDFCCVIQSDDDEVLESARGVLVPFKANSQKREAQLKWCVPRPSNGVWRAESQTLETPALEADTLPELLALIEYGALMALLKRGTSRFFSLHAALLQKNGRSVVVVGPKEAGKSTLSCALWTRCGWNLGCDDTVLVDDTNAARPAPRRVSLRWGSRELVGDELWNRLTLLPSTLRTDNGLLFHPHELDARREPVSSTLPAAVFFLARRESKAASAQTVPVPPALAALALLPYSTFLLPRGEDLLCPSRVEWGQSLPRLTSFAGRVPAFDLGRGPLDAMTAEVERIAFP